MNNTNITLPLLDVNSAHCALRVERAIKTVPAIGECTVDLGRHIANLTATAQDVREAVTAIRKAGCNVATELHALNTTGITCTGAPTRQAPSSTPWPMWSARRLIRSRTRPR